MSLSFYFNPSSELWDETLPRSQLNGLFFRIPKRERKTYYQYYDFILDPLHVTVDLTLNAKPDVSNNEPMYSAKISIEEHDVRFNRLQCDLIYKLVDRWSTLEADATLVPFLQIYDVWCSF